VLNKTLEKCRIELLKSADEKKVFHSGTGRIAPARMFPMRI